MPTKYRGNLVRAEIVVCEIKDRPKFLRDEGHKGLLVLVSHQTITEHSEALMDPESTHGVLGVVIILVCPQKTLEHLWGRGGEKCAKWHGHG